MATWQEMSLDCRDAAKELLVAGRYRSSICRSYYAVYCGITSKVEGKITFYYSGNNPSHESLLNLAANNLSVTDAQQKRIIRRAIRHLQDARVESDYVPSAPIDRAAAMNALRDASSVLRILEIEHEQ